MSVMKRWLWLVILVLGLISVVTGVFFIVMASSLEDEVIDGFERTRVKYYDGLDITNPSGVTWEYKQVDSAQDIEDIADNMKDQKYFFEELWGMMYYPDTLTEDMTYDYDHPLPDNVKYDLYFEFLGGPDYKFNPTPENFPHFMTVGYLPTIDGQLAFGTAEVVLGLGQVMRFIGITVIVIGIALMLVAIMLFTFGKGFKKMGDAMTESMQG